MATNSGSLAGSVVAITGGARGIGRATAGAFLREGARVAIGDLEPETVRATAAELGGGTLAFALDVTDRASFERFLDQVEESLGPIDVLVNNAGIQYIGPFAEEDDAATARQVAVNLGGVMTGTKLAIARMTPRGRGQIVNLASAAGKVATPGGATYSATKHAVVGLSESVRGELRGSGIEIIVVMPAIINTDMAAGVASARGVRPIAPDAVGKAIVAALEKGRSEVYVPAYTGLINTLLTALPRRPRDAMRRLMKIDEVLMKADEHRRAAYEARVSAAPSKKEAA